MRMDSLLLNEINREMRFVSTQAMIESQKNLPTDKPVVCTSTDLGESGIILVCSFMVYFLFK
ncbi:hypothetical protein [Acinetobacter nosocomialis]|uniref:hypothetical protein n=1 Tax=Acinetobacter nosocomialis TaxID=106654 RepID=UPI0033AFDD62